MVSDNPYAAYYEKQNFVSGQILTAEMLNHMEEDTVLAR